MSKYVCPCWVFFTPVFLEEDWQLSSTRLLAGEIRIAFVLYKHIGAYLSTENASMKLGSEAMATNYSLIVNSPVITAAINKDLNKVYLSDPVIFTIRHQQVIFRLWMRLSVEMCFVSPWKWLHLMGFLSLSTYFHTNTLAYCTHILNRTLSSQFSLSLKCKRNVEIPSQTNTIKLIWRLIQWEVWKIAHKVMLEMYVFVY